MKKLSVEEFVEKDFPMFYVEMTTKNNSDDDTFHALLVEKFITTNAKSWWFRYDNSYVFWLGDQESTQNLINWLEEKPFDKSYGVV